MSCEVVLVYPKSADNMALGPTVAGAEHLGLGYLAAYLNTKGIQTQIINAEAESLDPNDIVKAIIHIGPKVVGISPTSPTMKDSLKIAAVIKKHINCAIVLGGHLATTCAKEILSKESSVDAIVLGEGEINFWKYVKTVQNGGSPETIPSLAFRKNNVVICTPRDTHNITLDSLPYPYRESSVIKAGHARLITSRGCPYNCSFCSTPNLYHGHVRYRSPEDVVDEIEYIQQKYNVNNFWISDDLFISKDIQSHVHARSIAEEILKRKLSICYRILARADSLPGCDELLKLLQSSGLTTVFIGLESGSQKLLDEFCKGTSLSANMLAVQQIQNAGLCLQIGFIMFSPYTTIEDIYLNASFLYKTGEFYQLRPATRVLDVFPGTREADKLKIKKLLKKDFSYKSDYVIDYRFIDPKTEALSLIINQLYDASSNEIDHCLYLFFTYTIGTLWNQLNNSEKAFLTKIKHRCNSVNYQYFHNLIKLVENNNCSFEKAKQLNNLRLIQQRQEVEKLGRVGSRQLVAYR